MSRVIALVYGMACYAFFFVTFLYTIAFVENFPVPQTIDVGPRTPMTEALVINMVLMALFAIQHSVMARPQFKAWWTQFVPKPVERSTYVLFATLLLALLCWQWRPIPAVIWHVSDPLGAAILTGCRMLGFLLVLASSFLINHFELFGVHQVVEQFDGPHDAGAALPHAAVLQVRAASALSRLHHRILGDADDDGGSPAVCRSHDRLHLHRHAARGARSGRCVRRRLPPLPSARGDDRAVAPVA